MKGARDSSLANQSIPLPYAALEARMGHQQRSGQGLHSVDLLEAQEKWEAAGEFFLWELPGGLLATTRGQLVQEQSTKRGKQNRSLKKISDDIILTSVF